MMNGKAPKLILVADDQAFVRTLMVRMLHELGYQTRTVSDGSEAMLTLKFINGALVLDQQMDGKTGLEILQLVRTGETILSRDFPVLILTGHADSDLVKRASALDVTAILTKPVSKAQLGERMKYAMERKLNLKPTIEYAAIKVPSAGGGSEERSEGRAWLLKEMFDPDSADGAAGPVQQLHYSMVRPGMVMAEHLYTESGALLLGAGTELTEEMVERLVERGSGNPDLAFLSVSAENAGAEEEAQPEP